MSEVIRDAIIRLRLEQSKSKLESPDIANLKRSYEDQAKGAKRVQEQVKENVRVMREATHTNMEFGARSAKSFAQAGSSVLQFSRGLALMAASGSKDTQKLLENLVKIEAGVALLKGGAGLLKFVGNLTPVGRAIAVVTGLVTAGVVAWNKWTNAANEARKAASESVAAMEKMGQAAAAGIGRYLSTEQAAAYGFNQERIDNAATRATRDARIQEQLKAARSEAQAADKEWSRIEGVMRRRPGQNFGETSPEQAALLKQAGGYKGLQQTIANQARIEMDAIRRQQDLVKQQRDIEVQRLRDQQEMELRQQFGNEPRDTDPLGALSHIRGKQGLLQRQAEESDALAGKFEKLMDDLTRVIERVSDHVRELDSQLNGWAAAKTP